VGKNNREKGEKKLEMGNDFREIGNNAGKLVNKWSLFSCSPLISLNILPECNE